MDENLQDFISCQLKLEKTPVTAVLLSRSCDLNVSDAVNALELFFQCHKDDPKYAGLDSKYSICGSNGDRMVVKIVDVSDVDSVKASLTQVSKCQIFSIQLSKDLPLSNITLVNDSISKEYTSENMIKWGVILTDTDGLSSGELKIEPVITAAQTIQTKNQEPPAKRSKSEDIKQEIDSESRYVSRKSNTLPAPTPAKPKTEYISRKRKSGVVSDQFNNDNEEDDIDVSITKKTKVLNTTKETDEKLMNLFQDDEENDDKFSDDDDVTPGGVEVSTHEEKNEAKVPESTPDVPKVTVPMVEVPEFERVEDADGFITMKRNTPTPKQNPAKKIVSEAASSYEIRKPKTAPKKQASLMNFFKKK